MVNRTEKERIIENYLMNYNTYKAGIINCKKQLDYISPSLVSGYNPDGQNSIFYISNNTAHVALDRIEGKRALDLREQIEKFTLIIESIDRAVDELQDRQKEFVKWRYFAGLPMQEVIFRLNYAERKSAYLIRRKVLDKLLISLNNLLIL